MLLCHPLSNLEMYVRLFIPVIMLISEAFAEDLICWLWFAHVILQICFICCFWDFGGSGVKSSYNAGDQGSIPRLKIPWKCSGNPLYYSSPGKPHGQRNLVGYSPKKSQRVKTATEWLALWAFLVSVKMVGMEIRLCSAKGKCKLKKWSQLWRLFSINLPFEFCNHCISSLKSSFSLKVTLLCSLQLYSPKSKKWVHSTL